MRIFLLSLSLFFAHNTLTDNVIIQSAKAMAPGIAASMASGIITELFNPSPKEPMAFDYIQAPVGGLVIILGVLLTHDYLDKAGWKSTQSLPPAWASFFANLGIYCLAIDTTKDVKDKCLTWYNVYKSVSLY